MQTPTNFFTAMFMGMAALIFGLALCKFGHNGAHARSLVVKGREVATLVGADAWSASAD
jgi:hypothetical protein